MCIINVGLKTIEKVFETPYILQEKIHFQIKNYLHLKIHKTENIYLFIIFININIPSCMIIV